MEVIPDESTSWRLFQKPDVFDGDYLIVRRLESLE
jgi:hypothetical protein